MSNPKNWKKNKAKEALNKGLEHCNVKGVLIPARKMGPGCKATCRFKCHQRLSIENRQRLFSDYWKLGDKTRQFDFLRGQIILKEPKEHKQGAQKVRQQSVTYFFNGRNGEHIKVCQTMFLDTLGICEQTVRTARFKLGEGYTCSPDKRGKNAKIKPEEQARNLGNVMMHISSFKAVPSHYCREKCKRKYLDTKLNASKMHKMYTEWMKEKKPTEKIMSKKWYRNVFKTKFNIGFYRSKKDRCDMCSVFEVASDTLKSKMKDEYELHLRNKDLAQELKEIDKNYVAEHPSERICYAVFDMEKVLECPKTEAGGLYYKRKYSVFNFTIWDGTENVGYCYVWTESEAGKGANEVASCVLDFIELMVIKGFKVFVFWSDNCGNQNKNKYLFGMYTHACAKYGIKIVHKYLEKGHTWQEADNMHASIEKISNTVSIFEPQDWIDVMKQSAKGGSSYIIKEMAGKVLDFHPLADKFQSWKHEKAKWRQVREVLILPDEPQTLKLKHDHNAREYVDVCVRLARAGRPINLAQYEFQKAYDGQLPLKASKLKDLASLCNSLIIPAHKHQFFKGLLNFPELDNPLLEESDYGSDSENEDDVGARWDDDEDEIDYEEELRIIHRTRSQHNGNDEEDD